MDDDHRGQPSAGLRFREVALEAGRPGDVDHPRDDPRIGLVDGLGVRVVVLEDRQEGGRRRRAAREGGEPVDEGPAIHPAVREVVIEVDDLLVHGRLPFAWRAGR